MLWVQKHNIITFFSRECLLCCASFTFMGKVCVHFYVENTHGARILFLTRYMPTNGFAHPFVGTIFFSRFIMQNVGKKILAFIEKDKEKTTTFCRKLSFIIGLSDRI